MDHTDPRSLMPSFLERQRMSKRMDFFFFLTSTLSDFLCDCEAQPALRSKIREDEMKAFQCTGLGKVTRARSTERLASLKDRLTAHSKSKL